jgi:hypothetical protein
VTAGCPVLGPPRLELLDHVPDVLRADPQHHEERIVAARRAEPLSMWRFAARRAEPLSMWRS